MKFRNRLLILLTLLLLPKAYSQISLCDSIYKNLKDKKIEVLKQSLLLTGANDFPYNIIAQKNDNTEKLAKLYLVFFQEDFENKLDLASNLLSFVKKEELPVNLSFLFAYGERQKINKEGMIFGTEIFAESLNSNEDITIIICDLEANQTKIISSSRKKTAPSYLTQAAYNAFVNANLEKTLPKYYVSQLYNYSFFYDRNLSTFFDYEIPCLKLCFSNDINQETIQTSLESLLKGFSASKNRDWDHHFLMLRLFHKYYRLTESATIKIIILIFLSWLIYAFLMLFANIRQKRTTWFTIKGIWYSLPVTFLLILISFFLGKIFAGLFIKTSSDAGKIMYLYCIQLLISFFICAAFYTIILLINTKFTEKAIDYLIIFSCFINQSIFILVDISLFPIFLTICLLSILAFIIKNNPLHISVFFLMILLFIPYITSLLTGANITELRIFLMTNNKVPLFMATLSYPTFLFYFRILTSIARNSKKALTFFITHSIFFISILIFLPIFSYFGAKALEMNNHKEGISFEKAKKDEEIFIQYEDIKLFDDFVRTINISFQNEPLQCDIRLRAEDHQPLLYTDNDYTSISSNTGYFKTPSNPPKNLSFSYGTDERPSSLLVTAFFETDKENTYSIVSKELILEAKDE